MRKQVSATKNLLRWVTLIVLVTGLACATARQLPQPSTEVQQLAFEIQTATPTTPAVLSLIDVSTSTPVPDVQNLLVITSSPLATATLMVTSTQVVTPTLQPEAKALETTVTAELAATETVGAIVPTVTPESTPTVPVAKPLQGGEWDFETGFIPWTNPYGDACPGSGLANGWSAFTTRDQYGSSCLNQTTWQDNVYTGGSSQEITFAYVGNQAGIFKSAPATLGHRYTIEAYMRREFSPAKVEVALGIDLSGGVNWQAETVQWFPWNQDFENQWSRTEETVVATGEVITIFIKGSHPYPEPGGALRIDSISVVDLGSG
jgi:hypothetical protein